MRDLLVTRGLEPVQSEVLTELAEIGIARGMSVLGDMIGVHLGARAPVVRFVEMAEETLPFDEVPEERPYLVASQLRGGLGLESAVVIPATTARHVATALLTVQGHHHDREALLESAVQETGSLLLAALLDGLRPVLPMRGWSSNPRLFADAHTWWRQVSRTAIGGLSVAITMQDGERLIRAQFLTLMGPRELDQVLRACDHALDAAEAS